MAFKEKVKELSRELKIGLAGLSKPRLDLISLAVVSMCSVSSINLVEIAMGMARDVKMKSNYRRLQRFIDQIDWGVVNLPKFLLRLVGIKGPYTLLIDRTNWKFGIIDINFLVVAVLGDGYAIPIIWSLLPKKGNSSQCERRDLIDLLIRYIGQGKIKYIIGDREFIGNHWFKWLTVNNVGFILRLKGNMKVTKNGVTSKASELFNRNRKTKHLLLGTYKLAGGSEVYLSGFRIRNDKGKLEHLIIATSEEIENACELYADRWYIENMFKDLKSNGFQLEQTHITKVERLETLFGLLAIAYTWMIRIGTWVKSVRPQLFKTTRRKKRRISIFKAGLRTYRNAIFTHNNPDIWRFFKFLSCT